MSKYRIVKKVHEDYRDVYEIHEQINLYLFKFWKTIYKDCFNKDYVYEVLEKIKNKKTYTVILEKEF